MDNLDMPISLHHLQMQEEAQDKVNKVSKIFLKRIIFFVQISK